MQHWRLFLSKTLKYFTEQKHTKTYFVTILYVFFLFLFSFIFNRAKFSDTDYVFEGVTRNFVKRLM